LSGYVEQLRLRAGRDFKLGHVASCAWCGGQNQAGRR
jgi:hypothetical protein